jgi:aryl-alcohol dehydrogenase-like predicted oxidoreductase
MEHRRLGNSALKVPVLSFGTGTFGGSNEFWKGFGSSDVTEATRMVDLCLDAGVTLFDSADIYSKGQSEEISAKPSRADAIRCCCPPKGAFDLAPAPTTLAHHGSI